MAEAGNSGAERFRRAWGRFVGPEATRANHVLTAGVTALGAITAPIVVRSRGGSGVDAVVAAVLAADLVGGAYVNNTRASARWYERPGSGDRDHLMFAAVHVHPAVAAWMDRRTSRRLPPPVWAAAHYAYMVGSTVAIRRARAHRRPLGVLLTAGGLALDVALRPSESLPWFAWAYYPKLLMGHAAASRWSDADLSPERRTHPSA